MKVLEEIPNDQLECITACRKINNRFHDKEGWDRHSTFLECRLCQDSVMVVIYIDDMEVVLHHPNNDERPFDGNKDRYQPWFSYLRNQLKNRISSFSDISF